MGKTTYLVGSLAATAGLLVAGSPAFADSSDNDGINIGNDNNISVLPIQACGNNVAVLGVVAPILSPQKAQCVNAPIIDHPSAEKEEPEDDGKKPDDDGKKPDDDGDKPEDDGKKPDDECDHNGDKCDGDKPEKGTEPEEEHEGVGGGGAELPTAPTPEVVTGHAAVTG